MNKKNLAAALAVTGVVASAAFYLHGQDQALINRFPDLDPKLVKKAHRQMLVMALRQDPQFVAANMMDENYDIILRDLVAKMQ